MSESGSFATRWIVNCSPIRAGLRRSSATLLRALGGGAMHREPDTASPQWVPLDEAAERLSRYRGDFTRFVLNDVLARGRVPVHAMRRDVVAMLPDRVEGLLAQASEINVIPDNNA